MRCRTTRMCLLGAIGLALVMTPGCGPSASKPMGDLPMYELDFSAQARPDEYLKANDSPGTTKSDFEPPRGYRRWRYIVIHHSAGPSGNAQTFDKMHRAKGWDGLGYHFVIDNGNGGPDGRIETGPRWRSQKWGAHTGNTPANAYNNYGVGICLVGDFTDKMPTPAQRQALAKLVSQLCTRYSIPAQNVIGHRDAPGASTECPGDQFHAWIYSDLRPGLKKQ